CVIAMKRACANGLWLCPIRVDMAMAFQSSTTSARAAIGLHKSNVTRAIEIRARFMVILLGCQSAVRQSLQSRAKDMSPRDSESQGIPRNVSAFFQGAGPQPMRLCQSDPQRLITAAVIR